MPCSNSALARREDDTSEMRPETAPPDGQSAAPPGRVKFVLVYSAAILFCCATWTAIYMLLV